MRPRIPFWFYVFFVVPLELGLFFLKLLIRAYVILAVLVFAAVKFLFAAAREIRAERAARRAAAERQTVAAQPAIGEVRWEPTVRPSTVKRFEPTESAHVGSAVRNARADEKRRRLHLD